MKTAISKLSELCDAAEKDGTGVSVLWADDGGNIFAHNADERVVSASVIKVAIMCAALETLPADDYWTEKITWMIITSDNDATNEIIDRFGFGAVNAFCEKHGLTQTVLARRMLDYDAIAQGRNNYTSARDTQRLYRLIFNGEILTPALRETAKSILRRQRNQDYLLRNVWRECEFYHKTGTLDYLTHDSGVFVFPNGGKPVYLGAFLRNTRNIEGDPELLGEIGRTVTDYYLGE
ncbi:MAG: class A beta-lactamase-related serine hydrolase [Oscillospiraceae bacterium]|nr:class A beta-lactamase-related serine hydrolase [Oscillospiraceae bacterium]